MVKVNKASFFRGQSNPDSGNINLAYCFLSESAADTEHLSNLDFPFVFVHCTWHNN